MPVAEGFRTWVRCPPPPPFQPSRTALRGLDEIEDLKGGLGLVVRPFGTSIRARIDPRDSNNSAPLTGRRDRHLQPAPGHRCLAVGRLSTAIPWSISPSFAREMSRRVRAWARRSENPYWRQVATASSAS